MVKTILLYHHVHDHAPRATTTRHPLHLPPCTNESRHTHATPHTRHGTRDREFSPPGPASDLAGRGRATPMRHIPHGAGLDSTQISPCRTTPSCKHLEHLPFWSAVGSLTSRAGGLRAHPAGQMIRIGCHRDDGRNPLRSHLTRKKLPGTQVCVSHERVVPRRHLTSVPRPPIPRWCPVRAWLFFTYLLETIFSCILTENWLCSA